MFVCPNSASPLLFPQESLYSFSVVLWEGGCAEKTKAWCDSPQSAIHADLGSSAAARSWEYAYVDALMDMKVALCISSRNVQAANESVSAEGRFI